MYRRNFLKIISLSSMVPQGLVGWEKKLFDFKKIAEPYECWFKDIWLDPDEHYIPYQKTLFDINIEACYYVEYMRGTNTPILVTMQWKGFCHPMYLKDCQRVLNNIKEREKQIAREFCFRPELLSDNCNSTFFSAQDIDVPSYILRGKENYYIMKLASVSYSGGNIDEA